MSPLRLCWLTIKCKFGNIEALRTLSLAYLCGVGVKPNPKKACKFLSKLVDYDHDEAQTIINDTLVMEDDGLIFKPGVKLDYEHFLEVFRKADMDKADSLYRNGRLIITTLSGDKSNALKYIKESAEMGYYPAMNLLGILYCRGEICQRNTDLGIKYITEAAEHGCMKALHTIGHYKGEDVAYSICKRLYESGNKECLGALGMYIIIHPGIDGFTNEQAVSMLKEAPEDDDDAIYTLGWLYFNGSHGCEQDTTKAIGYFQKAVELGNALAANALGFCHARGIAEFNLQRAAYYYIMAYKKGIHNVAYDLYNLYSLDNTPITNIQEALRWLKIAVENDIPEAIVRYADYLLEGTAVPKDVARALRLLRAQVNEGYIPAYRSLASWYLQGDENQRDPAKGIEYLEAIVNHDISAATDLGYVYSEGIGVQQDYAEAIKWFRKGAEANSASAQFSLGHMYIDGLGIPQDTYMALHWYNKAAEQNFPPALCTLGVIYLNGLGDVEADSEKAYDYLSRSAGMGDAEAPHWLGMMYLNGEFVPKDEVCAVNWFKTGADRGDAQAMYWFGRCYFEGIGVKRDMLIGVEYLKKSAALGFPDAIQALRD